MAEEKGLEFALELRDIPRWVEGDPDRVRQVLVNLISNALKFTESGSVRVIASFSPLVIEVVDTGIGISAEARESLFSPFSQGDVSLTRKYQGTGLGLSIVWRLVQLMQGTIELESVPGQGSRFLVRLPLQLAQEPPVDRVPEVSKTPSLRGLSVLVVEDNPINRRVLNLQLERLGCRVRTADDGAVALAYLEKTDSLPDVILMDCQMPGLDGYATSRGIRSLSLKRRPLIIALTAHAMVGEREKCLAAGMDEFLPKPVSLSDLTRILG